MCNIEQWQAYLYMLINSNCLFFILIHSKFFNKKGVQIRFRSFFAVSTNLYSKYARSKVPYLTHLSRRCYVINIVFMIFVLLESFITTKCKTFLTVQSKRHSVSWAWSWMSCWFPTLDLASLILVPSPEKKCNINIARQIIIRNATFLVTNNAPNGGMPSWRLLKFCTPNATFAYTVTARQVNKVFGYIFTSITLMRNHIINRYFTKWTRETPCHFTHLGKYFFRVYDAQ